MGGANRELEELSWRVVDRGPVHRLWDGGTSVPFLQMAVFHLFLLPCQLSESQASTHLSSYAHLVTGSGPGPVSGDVTHVDPPGKLVGPGGLHPLMGRAAGCGLGLGPLRRR